MTFDILFFFFSIKVSFLNKKCNALNSDDTKTEFLLALNSNRQETIGNDSGGEFHFRTSKSAIVKDSWKIASTYTFIAIFVHSTMFKVVEQEKKCLWASSKLFSRWNWIWFIDVFFNQKQTLWENYITTNRKKNGNNVGLVLCYFEADKTKLLKY